VWARGKREERGEKRTQRVFSVSLKREERREERREKREERREKKAKGVFSAFQSRIICTKTPL